MSSRPLAGPLAGLRVIELPGTGPAPFAAMLMADLGADVIRVDRPLSVGAVHETALDRVLGGDDTLGRSRRRIAIDLKDPRGLKAFTTLARAADVLLESFRPGTAERLGIGPDELTVVNPRLVYTRVTGWGQEGPLAKTAGHEVNYLAVSGTLATLGPGAMPPLGSVGDLPAGLLVVTGALAALHERSVSGRGQVIDASILDATLLTASIDRFVGTRDGWGPPGTNALDGGSHYYRTYRTSDDRWISVGALEAKFHDAFLDALGIDPTTVDQHDASRWPEVSEQIATIIAQRSMDHWLERFAEIDTCVAPVLTHGETTQHPQVRARLSAEGDGYLAPAPAPRFSRTPAGAPAPARPAGSDTEQVLRSVGVPPETIAELLRDGVVRQHAPRTGVAP